MSTVAVTIATTLALLATPAAAATYGPWSQVACVVRNSHCVTGSIAPHSSQYWLRVRISCIEWGATWAISTKPDSGLVVKSGNCNTDQWLTVPGITGPEYYLSVTGSWATAYVANCTSGCIYYTEYS